MPKLLIKINGMQIESGLKSAVRRCLCLAYFYLVRTLRRSMLDNGHVIT